MALNDGTRDAGTGDAERDPGLDRAYASAAREEPPPHLDAAILAAARREVGARPRALSSLRAWGVPLSIAAVMVLSVSLVIVMREEGGADLMQASPPPAPQPEPSAPRAPVADGPAENRATPSPRGDSGARQPTPTQADRVPRQAEPPQAQRSMSAELSRRGEPETVLVQPESKEMAKAPVAADAAGGLGSSSVRVPGVATAPAPAAAASAEAPQPAATPTAPPSSEKREARDIAREDDGRRAAAKPAQAPMVADRDSVTEPSRPTAEPTRLAAVVKELDGQAPEKWLERIQRFRREGRIAEANGLLAEFKRRYPAHPVPGGLQ